MSAFSNTAIIFRPPKVEGDEHSAQIAEFKAKYTNKELCKSVYCCSEDFDEMNFCQNCDHLELCSCHHPLAEKLDEQKEYRSALNVENAQQRANIAEHVSRIADFIAEIVNLNNKINRQKDEIKNLTGIIHQQNDEIDERSNNIRQLNFCNFTIENLTEKNQRLERCINYASEKIDKLHYIVHSLIAVSSIFLGIIVFLWLKLK